MIPRPDYEQSCESCGAAVQAGETECSRCVAYAVLAGLNDVMQRLVAEVEP